MLKRIYIDNFRCLVNFELSVDWINLFLGGNGSGKSSVFEVLSKIQEFAIGDRKVNDIFKSADRTRWQLSPALLISHHPELINYLLASRGLLVRAIERSPGSSQTH